jgi:hypothetical protein
MDTDFTSVNTTEGYKVNGTTVINSSGAVLADIQANAGSIGTAEIADLAITTGKLAANAVTLAKLDEQVLLSADLTITTGQLLALNATPKTIVAAPGANKAIIPVMAVMYKPAGTAYGGIAAGENLVLRYTDGSGTVLTSVETTNFLDQATAQTRVALLPQSDAGTAITEVVPTANAALVVHLLVGEITTGDTSLLVRVYYRVVPTVLT